MRLLKRYIAGLKFMLFILVTAIILVAPLVIANKEDELAWLLLYFVYIPFILGDSEVY